MIRPFFRRGDYRGYLIGELSSASCLLKAIWRQNSVPAEVLPDSEGIRADFQQFVDFAIGFWDHYLGNDAPALKPCIMESLSMLKEQPSTGVSLVEFRAMCRVVAAHSNLRASYQSAKSLNKSFIEFSKLLNSFASVRDLVATVVSRAKKEADNGPNNS